MGIAAVGLVLGLAELYRHAAPFLPIFALLVFERRRRWFLSLISGGILGLIVAGHWPSAVALAFWTLLVPLPWRYPAWRFLRWVLAFIGASALYGAFRVTNPYQLAVVLFLSAAATVLYGLLHRELDWLRERAGSPTTMVLALTSLGCFLAGLAHFGWGDLNPALLLGGILIQAAAWMEGPAGGTVAGATLGITLALQGGSAAPGIGIFVSGGFVAGWLATRYWRWAGPGLLAGVLIYAVFIRMPGQLTTFWVSLTVAALGMQLVPGRWMEIGREWLGAWTQPEGRLNLADRLAKMADVMQEMARAFRIDEDFQAKDSQMVQAVMDDVCRKCSLYRVCWQDEFYRSYRGLLDLVAQAEARPVTVADFKGEWGHRCIRPDRIAEATNVIWDQYKERRIYALRIKESRALAQQQLAGLAELVHQLSQEVQAPLPKRRPHRSVLHYEAGIAKRPRRGGAISGDSDMLVELSSREVVFGLSDGMGVGPRAAWESGTAIALLEQLLRAGFSPVVAVHAVNTTLLLRSVEDHFATLDLVRLDRATRQLELIKVAAAPTFLRRAGQVEKIQSKSLPVGIVEDVTFEPLMLSAEPGDLWVLVTDGVFAQNQAQEEARLMQFLAALPDGPAPVMAETILSFMLGGAEDGRDDASVLVIRLLGGRPLSVATSGETDMVREWRRVTPVKGSPSRAG
ncbi:stage II sporulation protein E, protein serine/threonine phosphatase [Sulfobacillus acidophilus TPY]|nr:stage II sporulation protein E, protein serine/threonine phosphatase [Sulfobacillus acidophilus TPY]